MRAAIYARFSSELQDERSIIDQVALARKYAESRGLVVADVCQDAAISGASTIPFAGAGDWEIVTNRRPIRQVKSG